MGGCRVWEGFWGGFGVWGGEMGDLGGFEVGGWGLELGGGYGGSEDLGGLGGGLGGV